MEKVVLDTSVVVKWFVAEKDSKKALKLLRSYQNERLKIFLPEIASLELANALFFGAGYQGEILQDALHAFYSLKFSLVPLNEAFIQGARPYMENYQIAIYDALFIFLADQLGISLITADKKHHQKKFSKQIKFLS